MYFPMVLINTNIFNIFNIYIFNGFNTNFWMRVSLTLDNRKHTMTKKTLFGQLVSKNVCYYWVMENGVIN